MKHLKAFEHFVVPEPENTDTNAQECLCPDGCENCQCLDGDCEGCKCATPVTEKKSESVWSILIDGEEKGKENSAKDAKSKAKSIADKAISWVKTKNGFRSEPGKSLGKIKKIEIVEVVDMPGGKRNAAGVKSHLKSRKHETKNRKREPITESRRTPSWLR